MTLQELKEELLKIMLENGPEVLDYDIVILDICDSFDNLYIAVDHNAKEIVIS